LGATEGARGLNNRTRRKAQGDELLTDTTPTCRCSVRRCFADHAVNGLRLAPVLWKALIDVGIVLPIAAVLISLVFGVQLLARSARRLAWHEATWGVAMLLFTTATGALILGVVDRWSSAEFRAYWLLGAVLTVPYLALGELYLLIRPRWVVHLTAAVVLAATVLAAIIVGTAPVSEALAEDFPLGREVFGDGSAAHRLSQLFAYPAYAILVAGAVWSAFRIRGRRELRNRFTGTLQIAIGATIVFLGSGLGAGFGNLAVFSIGHAIGIGVMYAGFLTATRRSHAPVASAGYWPEKEGPPCGH
jgi:hypothetical protein